MTLRTAFQQQANSCTTMGSPFMGQLFGLLAEHWPTDSALGRKFASFSGDIGPAGASLPLRIGGGLHALVLSNRAPELAAVYPPHHAEDTALLKAVLDALNTHEAFLLDWTDSPPQTNEVRRSGALMPAAAVLRQHFDLPVILSELGASGGLNLMWDHFAHQIDDTQWGADNPTLTLSPEWNGPLPPTALPVVASRAGVDLNPLNPQDPDDLLRLTAYLWADQPERMTLTRAAASVMTAPLAKMDAIEWLEHRLSDPTPGHVHLIQHTVAWQYFPAELQTKGTALIESAGAKATSDSPLAWLSMETEGDTTAKRGAALVLRLWPGNLTLRLGRADFHGRWVDWDYAP